MCRRLPAGLPGRGSVPYPSASCHGCCSPLLGGTNQLLRRLFAILLLIAVALPLVSPLFALGQDAEANLPACCRREGKHHCAMNMSERKRPSADALHAAGQAQWQAPARCCPCYPASTPAMSHRDLLGAPPAEAIFAGLVSHPAGSVQTECKRRISLDRSRGKRGPPSNLHV